MAGKKSIAALLISLLALAGALMAQSTGPRTAHMTTPSKNITPAQKPGLATIFSNLGPTSSDAYNDTYGYYVLGPDNSIGDSEQYIAVPFTPKSNSTVEVLQVAVGYISGNNAVIVGLYSDSSGAVGTLLASREYRNVPNFGACCQLVTVEITPTAVTAGTQYWIGVSTDDTHAPNFTGVFESSNSATTAYNPAQEGWFTFSNGWPAAGAYGSIQ